MQKVKNTKMYTVTHVIHIYTISNPRFFNNNPMTNKQYLEEETTIYTWPSFTHFHTLAPSAPCSRTPRVFSWPVNSSNSLIDEKNDSLLFSTLTFNRQFTSAQTYLTNFFDLTRSLAFWYNVNLSLDERNLLDERKLPLKVLGRGVVK